MDANEHFFWEEGKLARGKKADLWNDARATASLPLSRVQLRWLTLACSAHRVHANCLGKLLPVSPKKLTANTLALSMNAPALVYAAVIKLIRLAV